ncbi:hypothetical protein AYR62_01905 [Secundilactobacillus paracollinoides]|uniref:AP2/ERF domain-containing protein n=1 Tax=Secundilactobacillus paracollinoides TaxID=240427 RepID=A0A1B2IUY6_9LACO|nr:AP2 domain-containing protein [Secundilactobacillus paracollinoides]ANZ60064.1 hypothetical protein AYR61_01015 [Secundilactobacillus paracollinoides]ANZ62980.1 hypothetical protein AYR62_01905 [Secundilactobacillus paracollinoides]ANZ65857.1 hypothetical protein AYR63_01030 [Secundilactobacillus paracollinoides]KRL76775.1 hypothetical protein FC17_GL001591 [Secundilactobacillus paracollinoides DSM 15502 = JCM 11969]
MSKRIDLTDRRFGRLVVLQFGGRNAVNQNAMWLCQCDCGERVVVDGVRLRSGTTKSCGCLRRELSKKRVRQNDQFQHYVGQTDQLTTKKGVAYSSVRQSSRNKSGVVGVSFDKQTGKWFARLMVHKHYVLMKSFPTMGEAIEARKEAERVYLK